MKVLLFERKSYNAKPQHLNVSGLNLTMAGTLDGFIDFVMETNNDKRIIYNITKADAISIISAFHAVINDINANCLFDLDPMLLPKE